MEELKSHNWSLTLIFCLVFALLGFITGKVTGSGDRDRGMMFHKIHEKGGDHMMKWMSKDGEAMTIDVEAGDGRIIIDIDTTYEQDGKTIRRVEKKVLKEE